jgi:hypothetical protein
LRQWKEVQALLHAQRNDSDHNLWELSVQFMNYLHHVEGVPYAKAWLGRSRATSAHPCPMPWARVGGDMNKVFSTHSEDPTILHSIANA